MFNSHKISILKLNLLKNKENYRNNLKMNLCSHKVLYYIYKQLQ